MGEGGLWTRRWLTELMVQLSGKYTDQQPAGHRRREARRGPGRANLKKQSKALTHGSCSLLPAALKCDNMSGFFIFFSSDAAAEA